MGATLVLRLTGGAGNSDPNASLGGVLSANGVSGTPLNNIFDDVSADEAAAGDIEYRALDLYNSGDATATGVKLYMSVPTSSTDTVLHFGHDATNNPHTAAASLETVANESTAPAAPAITFAERTSGAPLTLPDIPSGQACRVWAKRIVSLGAVNTSNDAGTIKWEYA